MRLPNTPLRKEHFVAALDSLNSKLRQANLHLKFYCIGGGALMLAYGARESTQDLDGSLAPADPDTIRLFERLKIEVAGEKSLPEDWINLQASPIVYAQGFRHSDFVSKPGYLWSNLQLMFAKPECLLAMKCQAMRPGTRDMQDIVFLLRELGVHSLAQMQQVLEPHFDLGNLGNDEVTPIKIAIASAFPGKTEYEPLRLRALSLYEETKNK